MPLRNDEFQAVASKPTRVEPSHIAAPGQMIIVPDVEHPDFDPLEPLSIFTAPALICFCRPEECEHIRDLIALASEWG